MGKIRNISISTQELVFLARQINHRPHGQVLLLSFSLLMLSFSGVPSFSRTLKNQGLDLAPSKLSCMQ